MFIAYWRSVASLRGHHVTFSAVIQGSNTNNSTHAFQTALSKSFQSALLPNHCLHSDHSQLAAIFSFTGTAWCLSCHAFREVCKVFNLVHIFSYSFGAAICLKWYLVKSLTYVTLSMEYTSQLDDQYPRIKAFSGRKSLQMMHINTS